MTEKEFCKLIKKNIKKYMKKEKKSFLSSYIKLIIIIILFLITVFNVCMEFYNISSDKPKEKCKLLIIEDASKKFVDITFIKVEEDEE